MKRIALLAMVLLLSVTLISCRENESKFDAQQQEQTEQMMQEANMQVGMPNITNFQQKKLMKMIYELCDKEDLICYAYIKSDYQGKLFFIGKCVGFGIPFSAQYTNPDKIAASSHNVGYAILPQPDPNGLFMPTSSSATWLMMIDPSTKKARPVYIEPEIVVSPFPLTDQ
jgi:hypothetical protein